MDFRLRLKYLTPSALPGTLARSGVSGEGRKSVRLLAIKENLTMAGVKNRNFGVKNKKTDSKVLSLKMQKFHWRKFITDWRHKKEIGIKNSRVDVTKNELASN